MEITGHYTAKGLELSAKLLTGTALTITRVAAGGGHTALNAVTMAEEKQVLAVGAVQRTGATVVLPVTLAAVLAEADYTLGEVGVYARDPEAGEILYRLYRMEPALGITAGESLVLRLELEETVSETAEVVLSGTAPGLMTEEDLLRVLAVHTGDKNNPHGVTAEQAGAIPCSVTNITSAEELLTLVKNIRGATFFTDWVGATPNNFGSGVIIQGLDTRNNVILYRGGDRLYAGRLEDGAIKWEAYITADVSNTDITAGTTALETGKLYLVYE